MQIRFTKKLLVDWAGADVVRDAEALLESGRVLEADYDHPTISGAILHNNRPLRTSLVILNERTVENRCPCYSNRERGLVCAHIIAVALMLVKRATDPLREAKYQEELRRASRLATVDESDYIQRVPADTPGALPAELRLTLGAGWEAGYRHNAVPLSCDIAYRGESVPIDRAPRNVAYTFNRADEALLYVLEDICEGPAGGSLEVNRADFLNLVRLHVGRELACEDGAPRHVHDTRLTTYLQMDLDRENGELILIAHTELPFMRAGEFPLYLVSGREGWVYGAGHFWPLQNVLPLPYHAIYEEPVIVARPDVWRFLKQEVPLLQKHARVESDLGADLFTIDPGSPRFRLVIQGSPASLAAVLYADYGQVELIADKGDAREHFALPDPDDLMRYTVRNRPAEQLALQRLAATGFRGSVGDELADIVGKREVLNFLGGSLPALRRLGWKVDLEGRVSDFMEATDFATPVVELHESTGADWFDVGFSFEESNGVSISAADVQLALRKGEAFIERNGRTLLIDGDAIESMYDVFNDCATSESADAGHFRLSGIYAPFVKSSLDALDGIDIEDTPGWRERTAMQNRTMRIEPAPLSPAMERTLRDYQKAGVDWLRFLEANGFCGLLADEMGLGKTLQTLAWIELERTRNTAHEAPALIVCPTSLVDNWAEEAQRFTPHLNVLTMTGADRHDRWEDVERSHIVVTSYALLRRDIDRYTPYRFSIAVLDEAQHIKNRSTQNAVAAKQVRAEHRLVLTGTPIENSVSDLWSIMDFLMPGYLGKHDAFRQSYELPISRGGPDAMIAQTKLRRKLHPFLLRRLKQDVAKDLPPKIGKVSFCRLSPDQQVVYAELLRASQQRISRMVSERGFNRCRMEILTTLLRLRQTCCHLGLLKLPDLRADQPSAKLDLFLELLDEAIDGGHRILVFSQFVTMLHILRDALDERSVTYCYLDGSTKDRMEVVHRFNTQRDIPVFLISLKAGGTGLNLTGADMVVHFDPWWNPAVEDQATDRAYRIGQKRTVYSLKLIARDTVEEKVLELQHRKKAVIDATLENDERVMETLTWDDVRELLSL